MKIASEKIKARKPFFEKEVEAAFYRLLKDFEKREKTPLQLAPYFTVLHAGRSHPLPVPPRDLPPRREDEFAETRRRNRGERQRADPRLLGPCPLDHHGSQKGEDLYRLLEKAMLEGAIPGGKDGRTGEQVYWAGLAPLLGEERKLRAWKLIPPGGSLKRDYNRDIGHTFGKQESTTLFFKKGESSQALREGMVSAIEYQWPYQGYALGVEDMFVVGPDHGINITR